MADTSKDDLVAKEYALLLGNHENIAARAVGIKTWSVTVGVSGLGLAYSAGEPRVLLFSAFATGIFWLVEALNRAHQGAYEPRIELIERHFREGGEPTPAPFQVFSAWDASFWAPGRLMRLVRRAFYLHVMLPHVVILLSSAILFALVPPPARTATPIPPPSAAPR